MRKILILCGLMSGMSKLRRDTIGNKFAPEQVDGPMPYHTVYPENAPTPNDKSYKAWQRQFRVSRQYTRYTNIEHVDIKFN